MSRGNSLSRGLRRASSLKEGAFGMAAKFSGMPEDDFPRPGQILPAPGRNVTAGDKERSRCRVATKGGVWNGVSRDGEGEAVSLIMQA